MTLFRKKTAMADENTSQDTLRKIQELEDMAGDMRAVIGARRTMVSNAGKILQQFQDSMYALLIEDEHSGRKTYQGDQPR
jgi:hypothetical protein